MSNWDWDSGAEDNDIDDDLPLKAPAKEDVKHQKIEAADVDNLKELKQRLYRRVVVLTLSLFTAFLFCMGIVFVFSYLGAESAFVFWIFILYFLSCWIFLMLGCYTTTADFINYRRERKAKGILPMSYTKIDQTDLWIKRD